MRRRIIQTKEVREGELSVNLHEFREGRYFSGGVSMYKENGDGDRDGKLRNYPFKEFF